MQLDPNFAQAWASLADSHTVLAYFGHARGDEAMPRAFEAAKRAIELDPLSAEGHTALACATMLWERDYVIAEREFLRALELNPHYVQARCWYAIFYLQWICGRFEEGIAETRRALESDPHSAWVITTLANCLGTAGQHNEAIEQARLAVERDPDSFLAQWVLGICLTWAGQYEEAVAILEAAARMSGRHVLALSSLATSYADWGESAEAQAVHLELVARTAREYVPLTSLAISAAAAGDRDEALKLAHRACDENEPTLVLFAAHFPECRRLRDDPRFNEILARLRLPRQLDKRSSTPALTP